MVRQSRAGARIAAARGGGPPRGPEPPRRQAGLPTGFDALLADSLEDGWRMLQVLLEDWDSGAMRFDGPGEGLFACHAGDGRLLGLCGVTADPYARADGSQPGGIGRLRRMYVRREARGQGLGRALVAAAAAAAWPGFAVLHLRAPASSWAFYESCGFLRAVGAASATHRLPLPLA